MNKIAVVLLSLFSWPLAAQDAPRFEVDPSWPGSLPDGWINGQVGGVCVDAHDHIAIVDRRNITEEGTETSIAPPPILMFDMIGNLVASGVVRHYSKKPSLLIPEAVDVEHVVVDEPVAAVYERCDGRHWPTAPAVQ